MPHYAYEDHIVQARSKKIARAVFINQGVYPGKIIKVKITYMLSMKQWLTFCESLNQLLQCHFSLINALEFMSHEASKKINRFSQAILKKLKSGHSLIESLKLNLKRAPRWILEHIHLGEVAGKLSSQLDIIIKTIKRKLNTGKQLKKSLGSPLLTLIVGLICCASFLQVSLPALQGFYKSNHAKLPLPTRLLLDFRHLLIQNGLLITLLILFASIIFVVNYRLFNPIKLKLQRILWKAIPLYQLIQTANFCSNVANLLNAHFPITQALQQTEQQCACLPLKKSLKNIIAAIQHGEKLKTAISSENLFDAMLVSLMALSEHSGTLATAFNQLDHYYQCHLEQYSESLLRKLEPLILTLLTAIITFIMLAVYLPILNLGNVI